jgi:hypothetical protein
MTKPNYYKAYLVMMQYFECIPEEEREEADRELKECGL